LTSRTSAPRRDPYRRGVSFGARRATTDSRARTSPQGAGTGAHDALARIIGGLPALPRMNNRLAELESAVRVQAELIVDAQAEIINYLSGQIGSPEFIDRIIHLFDGPRQRDVQRQAREALGDEEPGNIA
jgi:hypothetical protein